MLQFILYFDELEVCNPLGFHSGIIIKLPCRNVLLHIGDSETRIDQQSSQLIACVTSPNLIKYGFAAVLAPFIRDVNILAHVMLHFACRTSIIVL